MIKVNEIIPNNFLKTLGSPALYVVKLRPSLPDRPVRTPLPSHPTVFYLSLGGRFVH